jgi:hypothetical protein
VFKQLLAEYDLSESFSFSIDIPNEVRDILSDTIIQTELGITLNKFGVIHKANKTWENQSIIEDDTNHFHVDWYVKPVDNRKSFMLGIKTLQLLADKFQKENISCIRFWYSFQPPELAEKMAKHNHIEDSEHLLSDRLSFYTRRNSEEVITLTNNETSFSALLIIDI